MFGIKGIAISAVIIAMMTGGFYLYYKDSQNKLLLLSQNNAKLEVAIQTSEEAMAAVIADVVAANAEIKRINEQFIDVREQNRVLVDKLAKHDIGVLASRKPELVERLINNASEKALRCFEILSGAKLTDAERNAKDGRTFNSECPWLFDPSVSP